MYLVRGLPIFFVGFRNNLGFTNYDYWPYAQPPATLEDRWIASYSSGCSPLDCLAYMEGPTRSYATASLVQGCPEFFVRGPFGA